MSHIAVHYLPTNAADASRLADRLRIPAHEVAIHKFPDGEFLVRAWPATTVSILYATLDQPNEKLLALMFAAESLRRNGCSRLVLVAPYLCYMRQDTAFHPGEAISQTVIGELIAHRFDRVITVDPHLHRTAELSAIFPGIETDNLSAMPAIAKSLGAATFDPNTIVVGPDAESRPWVTKLGGLLGIAASVATKTRLGDRLVEIVLDNKAVEGRPVLLIDDIVSSGGTIAACARAALAAGVISVDVIVIHALFPPDVMTELTKSGVRSIRSTTSVPHFTNAIALDQILSDALQAELLPFRSKEKLP